jgi:hypothetical protein
LHAAPLHLQQRSLECWDGCCEVARQNFGGAGSNCLVPGSLFGSLSDLRHACMLVTLGRIGEEMVSDNVQCLWLVVDPIWSWTAVRSDIEQ